MTDWTRGFIAVDWGTTNRRAYRIDATGAVIAEMEDEAGATAIEPGHFPEAVRQITVRLGEGPLLLAGMIGSNRGWREAPYVPCPARVADLAANLLWMEPGKVAIVPGVADMARGDVMRGEEVQVLGLLAQEQAGGSAAQPSRLLCHPGTHTKWIGADGGAIARFHTAMTGELFALLRDHSILGPLLQGQVEPDDPFCAGAELGLAGCDLAAQLFSIRAGVVLGRRDPATAASWASGLLIGADVRGGLASCAGDPPRSVTVIGRPTLNRLYAAALAHAGVPSHCVDGATAFVAGMREIAKALS